MKPEKKHHRTEKYGYCGKDDAVQEAAKKEVPPLGSGVNFTALVKQPSTTLDALTQQPSSSQEKDKILKSVLQVVHPGKYKKKKCYSKGF
ncbi:MAG: hypothetical protein O7D30_04565 [Rickettsia endosymbiont of Ixodes persulcatus]|nr:hypothetical protein [Rickettsia endosymbiont of Ixodes persulcatus]